MSHLRVRLRPVCDEVPEPRTAYDDGQHGDSGMMEAMMTDKLEASRLTPVDGLQDLREALRDGEHIMVNGKPWRDVFCEIYDYAEGLERELRQKGKEIERLRKQLMEAEIQLENAELHEDW